LRRAVVMLATWVAFLGFGQAMAHDRWAAEDAPPAQDGTVVEQELEAQRAKIPFGGSVSLSQSLGAGTFTSNEYTRRSSYDVSLRLSPMWRITNLISLSLGVGVAASLVENYDSAVTYKRRWVLSDTSLSLRNRKMVVIPGADIRVSGSLSFSFPTSPQSQYRQLYFSSRAGLGFSREFGNLALNYSVSFYKNFNRYTTPAISVPDVGDHIVFAHFEGNEQLTNDLISTGGSNTSFGLTNSLSVGYSFPNVFAKGQSLSVTIAYDMNHSWTYQSFPKDELSAEHAIGGRGFRDSHGGTFDVSYQILEYLGVSAGVSTFVAMKSADNKDIVFPFFNFSDYYRNDTSFYATVTGSF